MKTKILLLSIALLFNACKDDDSTNPIDQLPPETQTGANTFGCLINGEVFTPRGVPFGTPYKGINYQYVYNPQNDTGYYNFQVFGYDHDANIGTSINIGFQNYEDFTEGAYLLKASTSNNIGGIGAYLDTRGAFRTTDTYTGVIYITKKDFDNGIVSGTFEFEVEVEGEVYHITEGRFDMNFTI